LLSVVVEYREPIAEIAKNLREKTPCVGNYQAFAVLVGEVTDSQLLFQSGVREYDHLTKRIIVVV